VPHRHVLLHAALHYKYFTKVMSEAAEKHCGGRLL
jgi:hypothetical protein